jgi:membrane protease YdiL (CAAX protease family)
MSDTTVYLFLVFAMPISETLFFRGMMQETYGFRTAALSGAAWSAVLFAPNLDAIAEVIVVSIAMLALNFAYAYVRERYGLAASWLSQTIVSVLALLVPRVL